MINLTDFKNIHCIGIGGVGVSAIAEILLSRGYSVSGSDMKQSEITNRLAEKGIKIYNRNNNMHNYNNKYSKFWIW